VAVSADEFAHISVAKIHADTVLLSISSGKYGISSVSVAKSANTHVKLETTLKTTFFLSIFVYVLLSASSAMSVTYAEAERQRLVTLLSQVSLTAAGPDAPLTNTEEETAQSLGNFFSSVFVKECIGNTDKDEESGMSRNSVRLAIDEDIHIRLTALCPGLPG